MERRNVKPIASPVNVKYLMQNIYILKFIPKKCKKMAFVTFLNAQQRTDDSSRICGCSSLAAAVLTYQLLSIIPPD
jgi:hypothetical protein